MTLERVVEHGLCTGCGLCESVAGRDRLRMAISPHGYLRPKLGQALAPELAGRILDTCPGVRIDGPAAEAGVEMHDIWGPHARLAKAHATDPEIRFKAASGGTLTALCGYLLDSGKVDFVLHVAASREAPMRLMRTR